MTAPAITRHALERARTRWLCPDDQAAREAIARVIQHGHCQRTCHGTLHAGAADGGPHGTLASGFRYWRPAELLAWLEGQTHPKRRRYAEALRLHLEQQRAA